jgi:hypothetical protein
MQKEKSKPKSQELAKILFFLQAMHKKRGLKKTIKK